jgi:hypothetical protein
MEFAWKCKIEHFAEEPAFDLVGIPITKRTPARAYLAKRDSVFGCASYLPTEEVLETPEAALEKAIADHEDQLKREERAVARIRQRLALLKAIYARPTDIEKLIRRRG